jgi:hypothetical protein
MPTITITKLYELVSVTLGKETAENLTTFIGEKISSEVETKATILATKEDLARESGNIRADMIKWMFVFWVGQALTTFGLILLFLKK